MKRNHRFKMAMAEHNFNKRIIPQSKRKRHPYGYDFPQKSFLDKHGPKIGIVLFGISTVIVIGLMWFVFIITIPKTIDEIRGNNAGTETVK